MKIKDEGETRATEIVGCVILGAIILLSRMPGRFLQGYLWAEDATTFIADFGNSGWSTIWSPYAGYLHVLPRLLVAGAMSILDLGAIPYALPLICVSIYGMAIAYAYFVFRGVGQMGRGAAALASVAPFLVPHSGEVFLTITNVQWVMAPYLALLVWESLGADHSDSSRAGIAARAFALGLLGLTGPCCVFLLPFSLGLALSAKQKVFRSARGMILITVVTASGLIQLWLMRKYSAGPLPVPDFENLFSEAIRHVVADFYIFPGLLPLVHGLLVPSLITLALICITVLSRHRWVAFYFIVFGAVIWMAAVVRVNPSSPFSWNGGGSRYVYIAAVTQAWILLLAASSKHKFVKAISLGLLILMAGTSFSAFALPTNEKWLMHSTSEGVEIIVPPTSDWRTTVRASLRLVSGI